MNGLQNYPTSQPIKSMLKYVPAFLSMHLKVNNSKAYALVREGEKEREGG